MNKINKNTVAINDAQ